jgi:hypothetical protein
MSQSSSTIARLAVLAVIACLLSLAACSTEGSTISAFGRSGSRRTDTVAYYDKAAKALDAHLRSKAFTSTAAPASQPSDVGVTFAGQTDTWYRGSYDGSADMYVLVRQPTKNAAGLSVMVHWHLSGLSSTVADQRAKAKVFAKSLGDWWRDYQTKATPPP